MSEVSSSGHEEEVISRESFKEEGVPGSIGTGSHKGKSKNLSSSAESVLSDETGNAGSSTNSDDRIVSKAENMAVRRSKMTVLTIIAITALAFGAATFVFTNNDEKDNMETQFRDFAYEVSTVTHAEAANVFGLVENMGVAVTSFALDQETQWPNILFPHFETKGEHNNALSKALQLTIAPLIPSDKVEEWENFAWANQGWIQEGVDETPHLHVDFLGPDLKVPTINPNLHRHVQPDNITSEAVPIDQPSVDYGRGAHAAVWQQSPAPHDPSIINFDLLSHSVFARIYHGMWETKLPVMSEVTDLSFLYVGAVKDDITHPHSFLMYPVYPTLDEDQYDNVEPLGFLVAAIPWDAFFTNLLPESIEGITVVLHNTCGEHYTYRLDGPKAVYIGKGDLHERKYNYLQVATPFAEFLDYEFSETHEHCEYDIRLYPTSTFEEEYRTSKPWVYAVVVILVFVFTACVFLGYDYLVQRRQRRTLLKAKQTNKIVSALFPSNVRDRLLKDAAEQAELEMEDKNQKSKFKLGGLNKDQLKMFMDEEEEQHKHQPYNTKPIADLFPSATVMFADIVGFTAWSSVREPSQVFTLLETVYHAFDELAKRRRVFKVETVGDCYVAVAGLPDPRPDHALVMARFSKECLFKMGQLTKDLEVVLGPDTGDLSLRIGLHSGPVTAGVLRGDKSRFQLFGDTVNTAARMEGTGERGRIHLSEETAKMLMQVNKSHWVKQRSDLVVAKGKGSMNTYWLDPKLRSAASVSGKGSQHSSPMADNDAAFVKGTKSAQSKPAPSNEDAKMQRLIGWNTDVLGRLIKQIIARREAQLKLGRIQVQAKSASPVLASQPQGSMVLDEVKEIICLPAFDAVVVENQAEPSAITLDEEVLDQLKCLVGSIAQLYNGNPFHNFEHASHVTMSVVKLLSRITTADAMADKKKDADEEIDLNAHSLHDFTYGITSDPLTQFACVFAALIHDVDHAGVPNAQLVKEGSQLSKVYKEKSVAEQNSVDISWNLFMGDEFLDLRMAICRTSEELNRFRELVVNSVMATDIVDKELKALRNGRWERAFSEQANPESAKDATNRKATIVIEHLIQASDVAHTMQHWHIYRKWNEKLFEEMYVAYREGRAEKDPTEFWYKGEMGFFDFYIIPLAKKLADCGVFGVSSDEYLNYAEKNRREWEAKGSEVVEGMIEKFKKQYPQPPAEDSDKASMMRWQGELDTVAETTVTAEGTSEGNSSG